MTSTKWRDRRRQKLKSVHKQMIYRCHNENHPYYEWYGARGIRVCERWHNFFNFYLDMGYPLPGYTIERIDNAKGYEPGNCAWVTMKEQARNKRDTKIVEYEGKKWCATDLANKFGVVPNAFRMRLNNGWSLHDALTRPVIPRQRRK